MKLLWIFFKIVAKLFKINNHTWPNSILSYSIAELGIRHAKGPSGLSKTPAINSFFFRGFDMLKIFQKCYFLWAATKHSRSARA